VGGELTTLKKECICPIFLAERVEDTIEEVTLFWAKGGQPPYILTCCELWLPIQVACSYAEISLFLFFVLHILQIWREDDQVGC
jgi:hypothetical protein